MNEVSCDPGDQWAELLSASSIGEGVHFKAFDAATITLAILAEEPGAGGPEPIVIISTHAHPPRIARLPSPLDRTMTPVAVVALTEPLAGYRILAMLCNGADCQFFGTSSPDAPDDTRLSPLPAGTPPAWVKPEFAVAEQVDDSGQTKTGICVGGDGMACWDGVQWVTRIEPGGSPLRAADARSQDIIAVGDAGRLVTATKGGSLESRPVAVDLTAISAFEGGYVATGEQGTIVSNSLLGTCSMSIGNDALLSIGRDRTQHFKAASAAHIVTGSVQERTWCAEPAPMGITIRSLIVFPCGQSDNSLVLTEEGVFGRFECACQLC